MNSTKLVQGIAIDYNYIYVLCCNNGCSDHIHRYGSNKDISNRMENRVSHCPSDNYKEICIRIDETSMRAKLNYYSNKSITISKRAYNKQKKTNNCRLRTQELKRKYFEQKKKMIVDFN